jgi:hypothetical protein
MSVCDLHALIARHDAAHIFLILTRKLCPELLTQLFFLYPTVIIAAANSITLVFLVNRKPTVLKSYQKPVVCKYTIKSFSNLRTARSILM